MKLKNWPFEAHHFGQLRDAKEVHVLNHFGDPVAWDFGSFSLFRQLLDAELAHVRHNVRRFGRMDSLNKLKREKGHISGKSLRQLRATFRPKKILFYQSKA